MQEPYLNILQVTDGLLKGPPEALATLRLGGERDRFCLPGADELTEPKRVRRLQNQPWKAV